MLMNPLRRLSSAIAALIALTWSPGAMSSSREVVFDPVPLSNSSLCEQVADLVSFETSDVCEHWERLVPHTGLRRTYELRIGTEARPILVFRKMHTDDEAFDIAVTAGPIGALDLILEQPNVEQLVGRVVLQLMEPAQVGLYACLVSSETHERTSYFLRDSLALGVEGSPQTDC